MLEFHTVQLSEIEVRRKVSPWTETPGYMASDFHGPSHKPLITSMRTHEPTHASNMSTICWYELVQAGMLKFLYTSCVSTLSYFDAPGVP